MISANATTLNGSGSSPRTSTWPSRSPRFASASRSATIAAIGDRAGALAGLSGSSARRACSLRSSARA
jgi:hypothetical protein